MCLFFCIPDAPLVSILMDWLSWRDYGRFDSALCNREKRTELHQSVLSSGHACSKSWSDCACPNVEWVIKRGIKCSDIHIGCSLLCDPQLQKKFLIHTGRVLKSIELNWFKEGADAVQSIGSVLRCIFAHCEGLQHLQLTLNMGWTNKILSVADFEALHTFISNHTSLSSFSLCGAHKLPVFLLQSAVNKLNSISLQRCIVQDDTQMTTHYEAPRVTSFRCVQAVIPSALCCLVTDLTIYCINNREEAEPSQKIASYANLAKATVNSMVDVPTAQIIHTHWTKLMYLSVPTLDDCNYEHISVMLVKHLPLLRVLDTVSKGALYERSCSTVTATSTSGSQLHTLFIYCGWVGTLVELLPLCPQQITLSMVLPVRPAPIVPVERSLHLLRDTKIRDLYLEGYSELRNEDITALRNTQLCILSMTKVGHLLKDQVILQLVPTLQNLHTLDLSHCYGLTYRLVMEVPPLCPTLRKYTYRMPVGWCTNGCGTSKSHLVLNGVLPKIFPHIKEFIIRC